MIIHGGEGECKGEGVTMQQGIRRTQTNYIKQI